MKDARVIGIATAALVFSLPLAAAPAQPPERSAPAKAEARKAPPLVSLAIEGRSLKEAVREIEAAAGVRIHPMWRDASHHTGLDPEAQITLHVHNQPLSAVIERLLEAIDEVGNDSITWQRTPEGAWQIGPKSRLNAYKRVHIYEVSDLIRTVPDHRSGPSIDLQQALSNTGSPISQTDAGSEWLEELPTSRDRAAELVDLIESMIEPEQWPANGGEGGTIRIVGSTLIIRAPDYMHRALSGRSGR